MENDSLRTGVSPLDAGRGQHLQVTVTSTQTSTDLIQAPAVLQLVKGTASAHPERNLCHSTVTCPTFDLIFYCSQGSVRHHRSLPFLSQTQLPVCFSINTCTLIQHRHIHPCPESCAPRWQMTQLLGQNKHDSSLEYSFLIYIFVLIFHRSVLSPKPKPSWNNCSP